MASQGKVLRYCVVHNGKVTEERQLKSRSAVTIGNGQKNTIVVTEPGVPVSFTVFSLHGDHYALVWDESMRGKIKTGTTEVDFSALVSQGLAKKQGDQYTTPITDAQQGRVELGEITLLWKFVTLPPEAPKPVLPGTSKGGPWRQMDKLFYGILGVSLLLHLGLYAVLASQPVSPDEMTLEEIPDRFAKLLIPEKKPEPPKKEEKKQEVKVEKKQEVKEVKKEEKTPEQQAKHTAAVQKAVSQKGLLKVLGALGPNGGGGAVADVFGSGGGFGDVASALSGAGGVAVATDPGAGGRKGSGAGGVASIGDLATSGGGGSKVGYGQKSDAHVSGSVAAEDVEVDSPDIDQGKLNNFIRARQGAIKACYEQALKRNPRLKGKLKIRFTILETGGLADITALENSLGSPEVASCIISTMRTWRTPFKPSSTVTVEHGFVFSPAS